MNVIRHITSKISDSDSDSEKLLGENKIKKKKKKKKKKKQLYITKTSLYNFDPLKPHFYIVKLGFTGVYIIFSYFCSKT